MKFLADMGISQPTVDDLRGLGHDAVHLAEEGLCRSSDPEILAKALRERRILLAHDLGFGELVAASQAALPSVVPFRLRNMSPAIVNDALSAVIRDHGEALERGAMITASEGQTRARKLPLDL